MDKNNNCHELIHFFLEQSKYRNLICFNKTCYFEGLKCNFNDKIDKPFINDLMNSGKIKITSKNYETIYYENIIKKN